MKFSSMRFMVAGDQTNVERLQRAIADRLKGDIYGQRVFDRITYQHPKTQEAALAHCGMAALTFQVLEDRMFIEVGLKPGLLTDQACALQEQAHSNPALFKRLESMAMAIRSLNANEWPGFSRASHGKTLRQLWCYALDAIETQSAEMRAIFHRNTSAFVSDLASEAGVRELQLIQEHMAVFGCTPSQIEPSFQSDVNALRDLAVSVALVQGGEVFTEQFDGTLEPVNSRDYLTEVSFTAPRHFQLTLNRSPYDFYDIGLNNPQSYVIEKDYKLLALSFGYQASTLGAFTVLTHESRSPIYVIGLPNAMAQSLQRSQAAALAQRLKVATPVEPKSKVALTVASSESSMTPSVDPKEHVTPQSAEGSLASQLVS